MLSGALFPTESVITPHFLTIMVVKLQGDNEAAE